MNLILLEPSDHLDGDRYVVTDARARHVVDVLRAEPGQELRVGLLDGPEGTAKVLAASADRVELLCTFADRAQNRALVDLVLAVPRPKSLRKVLPELTALGVDRLVLLRTWRVEKPFMSTTILQPESYRPLLHEGLMQGRRTREPRVTIEPLFKPFIEDRAPVLRAGAHVGLVAHPTAAQSIAEVVIPTDARVIAAVGPEGGFIPYEVEAFCDAGFLPVRISPSPLRVETACVALLAQIELLRMQGEALRPG